MVAGRHGGGSF